MDVYGAKMCMYSYSTPEILGGYLGKVNELEPIMKKELIPQPSVDTVAGNLTPEQVAQVLDHVQNSPKADSVGFDLPSDLPTTVTGPSQIPNSTTTRQNADSSTTVTETKTQLSYDESKIIVTQTTTTTRTAPNGDVISTEQETVSGETPAPIPSQNPTPTNNPTNPNPQIDPETGEPVPQVIDIDICKKNPDILACKLLNEPPPEEIPKEERNIELQDGPSFSGGSCIPPLDVTVFGNNVRVIDFATPCGWLSDYLRPLLLLMASISAVFIVMPRES